MDIKFLIIGALLLFSCGTPRHDEQHGAQKYQLSDFYGDHPTLEAQVTQVMDGLSAKARIGQMLIVAGGKAGKPTGSVVKIISEYGVGGVLLLGGEKNQLTSLTLMFDSIAKANKHLPLVFCSDAEPSLFNRRIAGTQPVPKTVAIQTTDRCDSVAAVISNELRDMHISYNFAPVLDMSPNNEAITNRTFGSDSTTVVSLAEVFVTRSQQKEVATSVKHFPGHGLVSGDTHRNLVTIDGPMQEVNHYKPLIDLGVISIMVGHIAVINNEKYNTHGLPSSCSEVIVKGLLKKELGFSGLVVTDAMNMGAVQKIDSASFKAVNAGCDIILMEPNEGEFLQQIYAKYQAVPAFRDQINQSVRKIIRLKICLGLL